MRSRYKPGHAIRARNRRVYRSEDPEKLEAHIS